MKSSLLRYVTAITVALPMLALAADTQLSLSPEDVKAPFGLKWGEPAQRIEELIKEAKGQISSTEHKNGLKILQVVELPPRSPMNPLTRALFAFREDRLTRITLQYETSDAEFSKVEEQYGSMTKNISGRYGPSEAVQTPRDASATERAERWKKPNTSILLQLMRIGDDPKSKFRIDVIYTKD